VQYRRVTELTPANPSAFNNLGAVLQMNGDFPNATKAFEQSLALEPTRSAYSNTGTMYYFSGRFTDAVSMFRKAVQLPPRAEDHRIFGNLADALFQIPASRAQAEEEYRRAIKLAEGELGVNPKDAVDRAQLAFYYDRVGDVPRAQQNMALALELRADDLYVQYYRALIAIAHADSATTVQALDRAITLGYPRQLVRVAPEFATLRNDARFRRLLAPESKPGA
jgi:Flp pilus assembly protein TadD